MARSPLSAWIVRSVVALVLPMFLSVTRASVSTAASDDLVPMFQAVEQALMNAIGTGDEAVWARVLDDGCVITSEGGQISAKAEFLKGLVPLPTGLSGGITVRDLTVQPFPTVAIVRFLADEWEQAFGQRLTTKYRITDTFRRAGSEWKMVASHTAVVTLDPPEQTVDSSGWPGLVGTYQLAPGGWTFHAVQREQRSMVAATSQSSGP